MARSGANRGTRVVAERKAKGGLGRPVSHPEHGDTPISLLIEPSDMVAVAFSPDGRTLVSGNRAGVIHLWDVGTGKLLKGFNGVEGSWRNLAEGHWPNLTCLAFTPDGQMLAWGGDDGTIHLWDLKSDQLVTNLVSGSTGVKTVVFSPDGKTLVAGANDGTIYVWEVESRQPLTMKIGYLNQVRQLTFSPDGQTVAIAFEDGVVRLWDVASGRVLPVQKDFSLALEVPEPADNIASAAYTWSVGQHRVAKAMRALAFTSG